MSTPAQATSSIYSLLQNCTKLSRAISAVLLSGYIVQVVFPSSRQYLALVAGRTLPCVWNVFSAGLLQTHILSLVVSILAILLLSKVIEPNWGSKEYIKYLALVNVGSGVGTFVLVYIAYALDRNNEGNLLYAEISGFQGILAGLLVALKQVIPETEVTLLQLLKLRAKHLAGIFVVVSLVASIILGCVMKLLPPVVLGALTGWLYLRYLQVKGDGALKGDPSDEFRFATFFPEIAQPTIDKLVTAFSGRFNRTPVDSVQSFIVGGTALPGSDTADAVRRRERGAKALEERLGSKSTIEVKESEVKGGGDIEAGVSTFLADATFATK